MEVETLPNGLQDRKGVSSDGPEFLQYVSEREKLQEHLQQMEEKLQHSQSKNYDLKRKCEDLEKQLAIWKQLNEIRKRPVQKNPLNNTNKKAGNKARNKAMTKAEKASKTPKRGTRHPVIPNREEVADNSLAFYTAIAELCPDVKLSVTQSTEKLFLEGDTNGDGLIDVEELDALFTKHLALYTRTQVEEILDSIDADGSHTLDFIEVLEVMHQVDSGGKTNLPERTVQKDAKGSFICSIQ